MAFVSTKAMLVLGVLMAVALHCAAATNYTVGGSLGWVIPSSSNALLYSEWAANATCKVGDTLVFNFVTNLHNVLRVTSANYNSCATTGALETYNTGPASVNLTASGAHYYICGVTGHCTAGQKVAITVSAASTTPTPSTTPTSPTTPTSTTGTNTSDASYHSISPQSAWMSMLFGVAAAFFGL